MACLDPMEAENQERICRPFSLVRKPAERDSEMSFKIQLNQGVQRHASVLINKPIFQENNYVYLIPAQYGVHIIIKELQMSQISATNNGIGNTT